jgi:hypothetical protein
MLSFLDLPESIPGWVIGFWIASALNAVGFWIAAGLAMTMQEVVGSSQQLNS